MLKSSNLSHTHSFNIAIASTLHQTTNIRPFLDQLISSRNIKSMVDIPCGDMNWMVHVDSLQSGKLRYFGGDVSSFVIDSHRETFKNSADIMSFDTVDIIDGDLLKVPSIREIMDEKVTRPDENILIFVSNSLWRFPLFHSSIPGNWSARTLISPTGYDPIVLGAR